MCGQEFLKREHVLPQPVAVTSSVCVDHSQDQKAARDVSVKTPVSPLQWKLA